MKKPRILFLDIETSPVEGGVWRKWETTLLYITEHSQLLSVAYKWQGSKVVDVLTMEGEQSDKRIVKKLAKLFEEADILIAHNGDQFDIKRVTARMVYYNLPPTKLLVSVDTKKVAKKYFGFFSNSLNDLAEYFGIGTKVQHTGIGLWRGCKAGDRASWDLMETYNAQDVVLLEQVYIRMLPWIKNHPNVARILDHNLSTLGACPNCGSKRCIKRGPRIAGTLIKQEWGCKECGSRFLTRRAA